MQQWWSPGHRLKHRPYEIVQALGQGGFGVTYKANNLALDVPVVIKTPNIGLQRDKNYSTYLESFKKEARQLAKLGMNPHPHIVRVFDFFLEDELPCIVMDYIPGNSLYDLVQMNGALSEVKALEYIKQIGSALSVCHNRGIFHRDVHPNNILIHTESGKAILIDFGISGSTQSTRSNRSGNKAFAPWEQLISFGEQSSKTPQVDIYTLAASLFYLLTGETPVPSLARKFNNDELTEPKQYNPQISDHINEAILKGMGIEAGDRPQTVEAWLKMLKPAQPTVSLPVQLKYTEPTTIPVPSRNKAPKQKVTVSEQPPIKSKSQPKRVVANKNNPISQPFTKKKLFAGIGLTTIATVGISILSYTFLNNELRDPDNILLRDPLHEWIKNENSRSES